MKRSGKPLAAVSIILFAFVSGGAGGVEVYKWVGFDGVTHYAETPPESDLAGLEVLDVVVAEPDSPVVADYRAVLAVANSIQAGRLERERVRLEKEKLLLQERQLQQYDQSYTGTSVFYPRFRRHRYPLKPYPHQLGRNHPRNPHGNGDFPSSRGGTPPGRVNLKR